MDVYFQVATTICDEIREIIQPNSIPENELMSKIEDIVFYNLTGEPKEK